MALIVPNAFREDPVTARVRLDWDPIRVSLISKFSALRSAGDRLRTIMMKLFLAGLTALCFALPVAAQAQDTPSYANPAPYSADANIHGRVVSFDGGYNVSVRDERGYIDNIRLHPGTIINPTGLTIEPGMVVSILGYNAGSYFAANQIDTPYQIYGALPYYGGHPWNYYGPSVSLGFFFGNTGWWHGGYFRSGYRYSGGVRVYDRGYAHGVYRGGEFHGRDFVAPREHGGYYGHPGHVERAHPDGHRRDH
jgi:hypothetical protein